jgi:endosialidase-like protein
MGLHPCKLWSRFLNVDFLDGPVGLLLRDYGERKITMTPQKLSHLNSTSSLGRGWSLIPLLIICFAFSQMAQATDLDGVLPAGNTADGTGVLTSLTTGFGNSGLGFKALNFDSVGNSNAAVGFKALQRNVDGNFNTAMGAFSLGSNQSGFQNTAAGYGALFFNDSTGNSNGNLNSAFGSYALLSNTDGSSNSAFGWAALKSNTIGVSNTATGILALAGNTDGSDNTASGFFALGANTSGSFNTASGDNALVNNTTGSGNTAVGEQAMDNETTGDNNLALGVGAGGNIVTANNVIAIGNAGADVSSTTWIGGVYNATTISGTTEPVVVSITGQLGTIASSEQFKKDIATMGEASEAILSLRPVTFHYKSDAKGTAQFGLIAEQVAKVNPALVLPDKDGKPYTVRYDAVNAMLLNEFLKEHRKVQDLEATVAQQQKSFESKLAEQESEIKALTCGLQKVNAQLAAASPSTGALEVNKPAPKVATNNQ